MNLLKSLINYAIHVSTPKSTTIQYDELKMQLYAITVYAEKLIRIIENELNCIDGQIAFLKTTKEELLAGVDYSKCENIDDMIEVHITHSYRSILC